MNPAVEALRDTLAGWHGDTFISIQTATEMAENVVAEMKREGYVMEPIEKLIPHVRRCQECGHTDVEHDFPSGACGICTECPMFEPPADLFGRSNA